MLIPRDTSLQDKIYIQFKQLKKNSREELSIDE